MIQALRGYLAVGLIAGLSFSQSAPNNTPAAAGSALQVLSDGSALGEARVLYGKGEFDAAIEKYRAFLKERPNSPDALPG